jgi:YidC/Oxa1 family membrane protein insertase
MDKRNIFFFISLSLTLLLINLYFGYQDQDKNKEWTEQQKVRKEQVREQIEEDITKRTQSISNLPIVPVYSDQASKQPITSAVKVNDHLLILRDGETPKTLYANSTTYQLINSPKVKGDVALYGKNKDAKVPTTELSSFGKYEVQLIFPASNDSKVVLGDWVDGYLTLPIAKLSQDFPEQYKNALPAGDAFVLLKTSQGYVPVGTYSSVDHQVHSLEDIIDLKPYLTVVPKFEKSDKSAASTEEQFFVLEDAYQQLVFSNIGGALVEINLPFQTKTNQQSVVKEIGFDRQILEQSPLNARFPLHSYITPGEKATGPFVKVKEGNLSGYYPLLRRDLYDTITKKLTRLKPQYYALNIVSEYPELAEMMYDVKYYDDKKIVFESVQPHRRITKTYSIAEENKDAPYTFAVTIDIEGDSRGLWLTTGIPEVEWISGGIAPSLKVRMTRNNKASVENLDLPAESMTVTTQKPDWINNSNGFLGFIIDPVTETEPGYKAVHVDGTVVSSRLIEIDEEYHLYKAADLPGYAMLMPLKSTGGTTTFRVFAGPFSGKVLNTVDATFTDPSTGSNPDYIATQTFHGWFSFISEPFAKFLLILMNWFYSFTGSWAFSIILLTVALRIMLYPLNAWSTKSMIRMQQIGPEVQALQEKHKKDSKKMQMEVANLYRERGINPLSGCVPLLIQMPFLIGMFDLLKSTFELRGASFIPGWIDDLAAPDVLFSWNYPVFFFGTEFHLLPILLGLVMFLQQRMSSGIANLKPSEMTDQQRQQKGMGNIMTVVFAVIFYNVPSGLNIYWLSSMLLGMLQQWWTQIRMKNVQPKVEVLPAKPTKKSKTLADVKE